MHMITICFLSICDLNLLIETCLSAVSLVLQVPVVERVDKSTINLIKHYPVQNYYQNLNFCSSFPMAGELLYEETAPIASKSWQPALSSHMGSTILGFAESYKIINTHHGVIFQ